MHNAAIPHATLEKFGKLADLLEQASKLARELSHTTTVTFKPVIPELKRPKHVPKDEEWFWSEEWQKGERAVNEDLKAGRYKVFDGVEALIADLHAHV